MKGILTQIAGVVTAVVEGVTSAGQPLVRWAGAGQDPRAVPAVWMTPSPDWSRCRGLSVLLGFVDGDETRPILIGLLDNPPADALPTSQAAAGETQVHRARTVRLEGQQEVIIECGKAKIHLRADGSVVIRGERILSRSRGVNRIKGGSVQIN